MTNTVDPDQTEHSDMGQHCLCYHFVRNFGVSNFRTLAYSLEMPNTYCVSLGVYHVFCLFVLRFYGPVNPMGSCRAQSVYLTTRLLGRLSPVSG